MQVLSGCIFTPCPKVQRSAYICSVVYLKSQLLATTMKAQKDAKVLHKHIHSRISYLYQAANYLAKVSESTLAVQQSGDNTEVKKYNVQQDAAKPFIETSALTRHLNSHLRAVSLRSQIRLAPAFKNSICKRCDTLLIPESTSTNRVENKSCGGKKPWADVLVVACKACGHAKRYPVGAKRQRSRTARANETK